MNTQTIFFIIIAIVIAFGLSYIQYIYKAKTKRTYVYVLAFLRFLSLIILLLLLINPIFKFKTLEIEKLSLPVLIDDSQSISYLDSSFVKNNWIEFFKNHPALNSKFQVNIFSFSKNLKANPISLNYKDVETDISKTANELNNLYGNKFQPILIFTDGNATRGNDFIYEFNSNSRVFPIVVGDTSFVLDANLYKANFNKYVYLNNEFPIEVFANVNTKNAIEAELEILENNQQVFSKKYNLSSKNNTISENIFLKATSVGIKKYTVRINIKEKEKNVLNNFKNVVIEVVDQNTKIAIVSNIIHPDIGALKRAIEKNSQREVIIVKPAETQQILKSDLVIFYQPNTSFNSIFESVSNSKINYWVINGLSTDYNWLNKIQTELAYNVTNQKEQYLPEIDENFNYFEVPNLQINKLPNLDFPFGNVKVKSNTYTLFYLKTRGINTMQPMVSFHQNENNKIVFWNGENIWKWRIETSSESNSFDKLIDKIVQFLAIKNQNQSLIVNAESVYNQTDNILISAKYFNKNLENDPKAIIEGELKNLDDNKTLKVEFIKLTGESILNISGLNPGNYQLKVFEKTSKTSVLKKFEVLPFNPELHAINANIKGLQNLAHNNNGEVYHYSKINELIDNLVNNPQYNPLQKEVFIKQKLIDWKFGLILLIVLVATEWFIRKYNGLK